MSCIRAEWAFSLPTAGALLFGLQPRDSAAFAGAIALLAAVALLASYGPARRASRLEPSEALREE